MSLRPFDGFASSFGFRSAHGEGASLDGDHVELSAFEIPFLVRRDDFGIGFEIAFGKGFEFGVDEFGGGEEAFGWIGAFFCDDIEGCLERFGLRFFVFRFFFLFFRDEREGGIVAR